jgi:uncharacterized protein (DUF433 family)
MNGKRIVSTGGILGGKPRITGTRIGVDFLLELMASGMSADEIVKEYPNLSKYDIQAVLMYAKSAVSKEQIVSLPSLQSKLIPIIAG